MYYKDYGKKYLGSSDIAQLTIRYFSKDSMKVCYDSIKLGGDGGYHAYIVDENAEIAEHYVETLSLKNIAWLDIIDDESVTFKLRKDCGEIKVYQAGGFGIIIQKLGESA